MKTRFYLPVIFGVAIAAVFLACGGGGGKNSAPQDPAVVSVSPKTIHLKPGGKQVFLALVSGSTNRSVTWSLTGGAGSGTLSNSGSYTAPMAAGTYYVTATSVANTTKSDTATVTVDPPSSLCYQDPPSSNFDFKFVRNEELSTQTHLVLDLITTTRRDAAAGLAFTLSLGATDAVSWGKVGPTDSMMVQNGTVFNLGTSPIGLKATLENAQLKAVVAQKGLSSAPVLNTGVLARVALDKNPGAQPQTITPSAIKFQILTNTGGIINLNPAVVVFGELVLL